MLKIRNSLVIILAAGSIAGPAQSFAQARPAPQLMSRADIASAAERADIAAADGDATAKMRSAMIAASLRQRLRDGDFAIGDRLVLSYVTDVSHADTLTVRNGREVELPGKIMVSLTGVLRSEVKDRLSTELLKYVRAEQIDVTPLMRVGVLGDVAHPGYFAFASDIPLTDVIMGAGGPTSTADLDRTVVRRGNVVYKSAVETRAAIAKGLTLDQFGLNAGDELVIGQRPSSSRTTAILGVVGGVGTVLTLFLALRSH